MESFKQSYLRRLMAVSFTARVNEVVWRPETVRLLWKRANFVAPAGNWTPVLQVQRVVNPR